LAEHLFDWAGVGAVHIRPTFFAENLYLSTGGSVGRGGKMHLPFGKGEHAPVSADPDNVLQSFRNNSVVTVRVNLFF
jgi:hypothetical protein